MTEPQSGRLTGIILRVEATLAPISVRTQRPWAQAAQIRDSPLRWLPYAIAIAISIVAIALLLPFRELPGPINILLLFVIVSIVTALLLGSGPSAAASVFGFVAVNFFIEPYYSVSIDTTDYILALVIYLGVSLVTG